MQNDSGLSPKKDKRKTSNLQTNDQFYKSNSTLTDKSEYNRFANINVDEFGGFKSHPLSRNTQNSNHSENINSDSSFNQLNYSKNRNILEINNNYDENLMSSGYTTTQEFDKNNYHNNVANKTEELLSKIKNNDSACGYYNLSNTSNSPSKLQKQYLDNNLLPSISLKQKKSVTFKGPSPMKPETSLRQYDSDEEIKKKLIHSQKHTLNSLNTPNYKSKSTLDLKNGNKYEMLNQKNLNEMSEQIHFGPVHKTGRNSAPVAKNIAGIDMMAARNYYISSNSQRQTQYSGVKNNNIKNAQTQSAKSLFPTKRDFFDQLRFKGINNSSKNIQNSDESDLLVYKTDKIQLFGFSVTEISDFIDIDVSKKYCLIYDCFNLGGIRGQLVIQMFDKNNKPLQRSYKSSFFSNELVDIDDKIITVDDNMVHEFTQLLKLNSTFVKFEYYETNKSIIESVNDRAQSNDKINENEDNTQKTELSNIKSNNESGSIETKHDLISVKHELNIEKFVGNKIMLKNPLPDSILNKLKPNLKNKISVSLFTQSVIMPNYDQLSEPTEKWSSVETYVSGSSGYVINHNSFLKGSKFMKMYFITDQKESRIKNLYVIEYNNLNGNKYKEKRKLSGLKRSN